MSTKYHSRGEEHGVIWESCGHHSRREEMQTEAYNIVCAPA